jgi:hypothetical protein
MDSLLKEIHISSHANIGETSNKYQVTILQILISVMSEVHQAEPLEGHILSA